MLNCAFREDSSTKLILLSSASSEIVSDVYQTYIYLKSMCKVEVD